MDTHLRTLLKTITWRIIAIIITIVGIYFFHESWSLALSSGIVINIFKTFFYYGHERIWAAISWQHIKKKKHDTHLRTLVKTISWKLITVIITTIIMYFYIQDWKLSFISSFGINSVKAVFYYLHERAWNKTHYGRKR